MSIWSSLIDIRFGQVIFIDFAEFFGEGFELGTDGRYEIGTERRHKIGGFGLFHDELLSIMSCLFLFQISNLPLVLALTLDQSILKLFTLSGILSFLDRSTSQHRPVILISEDLQLSLQVKYLLLLHLEHFIHLGVFLLFCSELFAGDRFVEVKLFAGLVVDGLELL